MTSEPIRQNTDVWRRNSQIDSGEQYIDRSNDRNNSGNNYRSNNRQRVSGDGYGRRPRQFGNHSTSGSNYGDDHPRSPFLRSAGSGNSLNSIASSVVSVDDTTNSPAHPSTWRPDSPIEPPPNFNQPMISSEPVDEIIKSVEKWDEFDLKDDLLRGIYAYGFENPSQIQKTAILPIVQGRDVIAQAPSGTGKTGAFTIGSLQHVDVKTPVTQIMILAPTHELVKQIASVVQSVGSVMEGLVVKTIIGGTPISEDAASMKQNPPHVIVGTTGRVLDMINRRHIQCRNVKLLVMDEADEMLSRGFKEQIYNIFQSLSENIQVALFSATIPDEILQLTKQFMRNPVKITIIPEKLNLEGIQQFYVAVPNDNAKYETLKDLFSALSVKQCIIYANSVERVADLCFAMNKDGFSVGCIHSSMNSEERNRAIAEFRTGTYRVLISSNVTARGIDIQQVSTVINFDIPRCVHNYLHRIGRGGRWGRKGLAINFVTKEDIHTMKYIEQHYKSTIEELPMNFADLV